MARARSSFRDRVAKNSQQQRTRSTSYGHLLLPKGINMFKEEPGSRVSLDILPYIVTDATHPDRDVPTKTAVEGSMWYRRPYKLHRSIGAENTSVVCPTSVGKKCPICEYRAKLLAEGTKWDDDAVKALRGSDRNLYYVVPKGIKKFDEKPHIWDISQFLFQKKLNDELEENDEFGDFPDLENGLTLRIRFSEEKIEKNTFADTARIDFDARDYKYTDTDIRKLASLDDVLDIKTYKDIELLFLDQDEPSDDDDDSGGQRDDERPARSARQRPDDDDDDDEKTPPRRQAAADDDDDNDRKDRGSRRGRTSARAASTADDDDGETEPPSVYRRRATGKDAEEPEVEKKEEVQRTPSRREPEERVRPQRGERQREAETTERCPHKHRFGRDADKFDECEECKLWSECMDAADAARASA